MMVLYNHCSRCERFTPRLSLEDDTCLSCEILAPIRRAAGLPDSAGVAEVVRWIEDARKILAIYTPLAELERAGRES